MATTPKKAASKAAKKQSRPTSSISLASLEREETREEFTVELPDGSSVVIGDPQDVDLISLTSVENPIDVFESAMSEEDYERLLIQEGIKGWQFRQIFDAWRAWYGLGTPGELNA